HGDPDARIAFFEEQGGGHGAVHAAAHRHHHPAFGSSRHLSSRPFSRALHRRRSLSTSGGTTSRTRSTSSRVLLAPSENRMALSASSRDCPMARSTWEGSMEPEAQAEPVDASIPRMSRLSRSDSPSTPSKA